MIKKIIITAFIFMLALPAWAVSQENSMKDTVWLTRTDQLAGFYMVEFSETDKYVAGYGMSHTMFYDSETGREIKRFPNNHEVEFLSDDTQFLQVSVEQDRIDLYNFEDLSIIDSFETDGTLILNIHLDEELGVVCGMMENGIRIWDLNTRSILRTHDFGEEEFRTKNIMYHISLTCDKTRIRIAHSKLFEPDPQHPQTAYAKKYNAEYDFITFEKLYETENYIFDFRFSNTCKFIANKSGLIDRSDFGALIYDGSTNELIAKLPVNGPSLSGMEFTSDDRYFVTSELRGLSSKARVWDTQTWDLVYEYPLAGSPSISISHDDKYILMPMGSNMFKFYLRTEPNSVIENPENEILLFPNPAESDIMIENIPPDLYKVNLIAISGQDLGELFNGFVESHLSIDISAYPSGSYFLRFSSDKNTYDLQFSIVR